MSTVHTQLLTDDASGLLLERSFRLKVVSGPDQGKEHMLDEGTTMVGTHNENDLVLTDADGRLVASLDYDAWGNQLPTGLRPERAAIARSSSSCTPPAAAPRRCRRCGSPTLDPWSLLPRRPVPGWPKRNCSGRNCSGFRNSISVLCITDTMDSVLTSTTA